MENQQAPSESIVRKIQLLLNLASRPEDNEKEAAAAMAKAQELLAAYNLDLLQVQETSTAGVVGAIDAKREKSDIKLNATYAWTRRLVQGVAEANYCVYLPYEARVETKAGQVKYVKRHCVLGRVDNTAVVLVMSQYLWSTVMRLLPYEADKKSWLGKEAMLWCEGCTDRLIERLQAKAAAMRTPDYATQGEKGYYTAIAVRDMAKAEEIGNYDAINGPGAWARKEAAQARWNAEWAAGREDREKRRQLEAEQEAAKLLAESPAELARREREEARQARRDEEWNERYYRRQARERERELNRRYHPAYQAGRDKAEDVGLDSQLDKGADRKSLR